MDGDSMRATADLNPARAGKPMDQVQRRYMDLESNRTEVINRAEEAAALTIPSIFPRANHNENETIPKPWQAVGARAVNNLANKLLLTLFPVSNPFFKLELSEGLIQQLEEQDKSVKNDFEKKLLEQENIIQSDLETSNFRTKNFEVLRQLIVTGNMLMYIPKEGEPMVYRLDKYVVKRASSGKVLEIILKESISREEMPDVWLSQLKTAGALKSSEGKDVNSFAMFTQIKLKDKYYHEAKYIAGVELEGSKAKYKETEPAWLPLRWSGLSGEDYGRSYTDEYMADLTALEGLSRAIQEHAAIAAHTFFLVRPGSQASLRDMATVPNGGFIAGEEGDIIAPEVGKANDMGIAMQMYTDLKATISQAFLLTQVRDSERTTAEEIRLLANELETALGGAYSLLAHTFQKPLLTRQIARLMASKQLAKVGDKDIEPKVIVGLEGLGRGTDLEKILKFGMAAQQLAPLAQISQRFDLSKALRLVATGVGLDNDSFLHSDEEMQQKAQDAQKAKQQEQSAELAKAAAPNVAGAMANGAITDPESTQNAMAGMSQMMQQQQQRGR